MDLPSHLLNDTAHILCSVVCETVWCPSVCPSISQQQQTLLLLACRVGYIDRLWQAPSSTASTSKHEQCHVEIGGTRINTDYLASESGTEVSVNHLHCGDLCTRCCLHRSVSIILSGTRFVCSYSCTVTLIRMLIMCYSGFQTRSCVYILTVVELVFVSLFVHVLSVFSVVDEQTCS